MTKKRAKIGLALGTGAARGLAHIGVIKVLVKEGIPIDFIAGSSMGALVGGCYAAGLDIDTLEKLAYEIDLKQVRRYFDPTFSRHGLVHGRKIEEIFRSIIGDIAFKDLKIPLSVMTTDLISGKEVVLSEGSVVKALRASISIPVFFKPVQYGEMLLVDGGLVDPIPVGLVAKMGADIVIAVDVTRDVERSIRMARPTRRQKGLRGLLSIFRRGRMKEREEEWAPSMFKVMIQTIKIAEAKIAELQLAEEKVDVLIKPTLDDIYFLEFTKARQLIALGEKATRDVLPLIHHKIREFQSRSLEKI